MSIWDFLKRKPPPDFKPQHEGGAVTARFVDIVVVFDVETILENCPEPSRDPKKPTRIPQDGAYLLTETRFLADPATHATESLSLHQVLDCGLLWHGWSLSHNILKGAIITGIDSRSRNSVTAMATGFERVADVPIPLRDKRTQAINALKFETQKQTRYYLASAVLHPGKEEFDIRFIITERDRSSGGIDTVGYFIWSPSLNVKAD